MDNFIYSDYGTKPLEIFNFWNSKGIIKHQDFDKMKKSIEFALSKNTLDEIKTAIDNYVEVFFSEYYFDYKWSLRDFIRRNKIESFLPGGSILESYIQWKEKTASPTNERVNNLSSEETTSLEILNNGYDSWLNLCRKVSYKTYLLTDHWQSFKKLAIENSHSRCRLCNSVDKKLNVHHTNYDNLGCETFNDVIVLCEDCHSKFHGKD